VSWPAPVVAEFQTSNIWGCKREADFNSCQQKFFFFFNLKTAHTELFPDFTRILKGSEETHSKEGPLNRIVKIYYVLRGLLDIST
jgi:hypothetical protein